MRCSKFKSFERGRISAAAFEAHARHCSACSGEAAADRRLSEETMKLQAPISVPGLWDRIEFALQAEAAEAGPRSSSSLKEDSQRRFRIRPLLFPVAAAALLLATILVILPSRTKGESGLLAAKALARVEAQEAEYLAAITDLERIARPKISLMDLSLMSLYQDRLAVIDAQIDKCRSALAANPANAHIRRYLLAALQDKKKTLNEALSS